MSSCFLVRNIRPRCARILADCRTPGRITYTGLRPFASFSAQTKVFSTRATHIRPAHGPALHDGKMNASSLFPSTTIIDNRQTRKMASIDSTLSSSVVSTLEREEIIPDVVPASFRPSVLFSVYYPSGKEVLLGNEMTKEEAGDEPEVAFTPMVFPESKGTTDSPTYTLVMTDPDAPSRKEPKYRQFRHWVITGLKSPASASPIKDTSSEPEGAVTKSNLYAIKTKGSTTPYRAPGPPPGSGFHRYIFLLFEEPAGKEFTVPDGAKEYGAALEERRSWNAVEFGEKYGLKLVGANYFLVKGADA